MLPLGRQIVAAPNSGRKPQAAKKNPLACFRPQGHDAGSTSDTMAAAHQNAALRFGPYLTPVVAPGVVVECEVRGLVKVVGMSTAPIRWPIGERDGETGLVVFKALARAVRQETPEAVAAAFGVSTAIAQHWQAECDRPRSRKKQTRKNPPIPWKPRDDELINSLSLAEAARLTGRTLTAVRKRRRLLGLPDGRLAAQKAARAASLEQTAQAACTVLRARTEVLSATLEELRWTLRQAKASLEFWRSHEANKSDVRWRGRMNQ